MKLDRFWTALDRDFDVRKSALMCAADAAFYSDHETRCLDAISRLYDLFDEEFGSAAPLAA